MIEKTLLNYLKNNLSVPAYLEKPRSNVPQSYVLIEKTGSRLNDHIKGATIAIQSYSDSLAKTIELNEEVKELMLASVILDEIGDCGLNTDYNYTDTQEKKYRYQAIFDITHY